MNCIGLYPNILCRCGTNIRRSFTTSAVLEGKKTRKSYDHRRSYPPTGKDINAKTEGGNKEYPKLYGRHGWKYGKTPHLTGYYNDHNHFVKVKEMMPEFVVPDLTDFKLKPYVSYKTKDVYQSEFTPENLFHATYGKEIQDDFAEEKGTIKEIIESALKRHAKS